MSCQKDNDFNSNVTSEIEDAGNIYVSDGALHFKSIEVFCDEADKIANMNNEDFLDFVDSTGFNSYRAEFYEYQMKNEQQLHIDTLDNIVVSDSITSSFDVLSHFYRSIIDKNGVFYVDNVKHIVKGTTIKAYTLSKSKSFENLIGTTSYLFNSAETKSTVKYDYPEKYYTADGDRKAITQPTVYETSVFTSSGDRVRQYKVEVFVDGMKWSWGKWRHYSTEYRIKDFGYYTTNMSAKKILCSYISSGGESSNHTFVFNYTINYDAEDWKPVDIKILFEYNYATRGTAAFGYGTYSTK